MEEQDKIKEGVTLEDFDPSSVSFIRDLSPAPDYVFNEDKYLQELKDYVDSTYGQHYAANKGKLQTTQLISKIPERGLVFCTTNILKYADRFGIKDGHNRKDLMKILHYGLIALSNLDALEDEETA